MTATNMSEEEQQTKTKMIMGMAHKGKSPFLRKIKGDEIVIEHDDCTREEGLELTKITESKIAEKYRYEVWDHGGKCPHIHIKGIKGLTDLTAKLRTAYKRAFLLRYAGDPDRVDLSLATKDHLIAKEEATHWKVIAEGKPYGKKSLLRAVNENASNVMETLVVETKRFEPDKEYAEEDTLHSLVQQHGIEVEDNKILCVFHEEKTPSLHLYPKTRTCYCFGCCKWANYDMLKRALEASAPQDISLLQEHKLLDILCTEIEKKFIGDTQSVKFVLLALCSIYVHEPMQKPNLMLSSQSSSGKSHMVKSICKLFDLTGRVEMYSKITPQALAYLHSGDEEHTWDGKLLYIEDAQTVLMNSETFKVFISEGLEKTASVKDNESQVVMIRGKPLVFATTANVDLQDEMSNRFITIPIDERFEQIVRVVDFQAESASTEKTPSYDKRTMQSLKGLKDVRVIVPYAPRIAPSFYVNTQRVKRDFPRFIALIQSHAALHQHQREKTDDGAIIATEVDYNAVRELYQVKILDGANLYGLSHREQKALDDCRTFISNTGPFKASQIHGRYPYVSLPTWIKWLEKFCKLGLLVTGYIEPEFARPYTEYRMGLGLSVQLKQFNELEAAEKNASKQHPEKPPTH